MFALNGLTELKSSTTNIQMVNARFSAIIASSNSKKKYKHLFLHPYIPIFSVSEVELFLSSCDSNGSMSLFPSLNLLIITKYGRIFGISAL